MAEASKNYFHTEITAPGKIIIFGEHSVVYGKKAIAATLGLYTNASLTENDSNAITLEFPDIGYEETFSLSEVNEWFKQPDTLSQPEFIQTVQKAFYDFYSKHGKKPLTLEQRYSVQTFFQSYVYLDVACSGFVLRVETSLPLSSGAGSSASFSVVVTAALCLLKLYKNNSLSEYIERDNPNEPPKLTDNLRRMISEKAYICETIFHGTPSGIDHCVIIYGYTIEFLKGSKANTINTIDGAELDVLLVDTKVPRSSKRQVEVLHRLKEKYPETVLNILDAMGNISNEAVELLENMKMDRDLISKYEARLGDLIEFNQGLLRCVRLSHESLEKVCDIAKRQGLRAKLTGAGGGGLAFVYLPRETTDEVVKVLRDEFYQAGFVANRVLLGGPGLAIKSLTL